ncbi:MAG: hypothetical protein WCJ37_07060, partial [Syntrophus sp. (in: bacteria)]
MTKEAKNKFSVPSGKVRRRSEVVLIRKMDYFKGRLINGFRINGCFLALFFLVFLFVPLDLHGGDPFSPNDPYFTYNNPDGFPGQWHLENNAPTSSRNDGNSANLRPAWTAGYTGKGVVIGIIDDGVEGSHEDLMANYRKDLSR